MPEQMLKIRSERDGPYEGVRHQVMFKRSVFFILPSFHEKFPPTATLQFHFSHFAVFTQYTYYTFFTYYRAFSQKRTLSLFFPFFTHFLFGLQINYFNEHPWSFFIDTKGTSRKKSLSSRTKKALLTWNLIARNCHIRSNSTFSTL